MLYLFARAVAFLVVICAAVGLAICAAVGLASWNGNRTLAQRLIPWAWGACVVAWVLCVLAWSTSAHADTIRCRRGQYPLLQLEVFACSRLTHKPDRIVLDEANFKRFKAEYERCLGRAIPPGVPIKLCGVPVVSNHPEVTT